MTMANEGALDASSPLSSSFVTVLSLVMMGSLDSTTELAPPFSRQQHTDNIHLPRCPLYGTRIKKPIHTEAQSCAYYCLW